MERLIDWGKFDFIPEPQTSILGLSGIARLWYLISENGLEYLRELVRNTSYVFTVFMKLLCNSSSRLPELVGAIVNDPSLLVDANREIWNDIDHLETKAQDLILFLSELKFGGEEDSGKRERLNKTITALYRKSRKSNMQIAKDFIGNLRDDFSSDSDSNYDYDSDSDSDPDSDADADCALSS